MSKKKWPRVELKDVCELIVDCVNKTAPTVEEPTPYRMIRTTNVRDGEVDVDNVKYVTEEVYNEWIRRGAPQRGDVILTREAPLGKVGLLRNDEGVFLGQRLVMYRADPDVLDNRFLLYSFMSHDMQGQMKALGSGSTVEHLRVPHAKTLEISLPPLPVQRRIGSILAAYDDLIHNNARRIELLEEMAQAVYREWFVEMRFPGHADAEMRETEALGPVPMGWEVVPFTEVAEVLSGGTPKTTVEEYWDGPFPFFSPKDMPSSFYVTDTSRYVTEEGIANCSSELYPKDTVFITARGTVGRVVMPSRGMAMNQSCYALRGKEGVDQLFVFFSIRSRVRHLKQRAHGAVFDTIIMSTFDDIYVVKPPQALIDRFVSVVRPLFDQMLNLIRRNETLRRTRDLLLPRLVNSEVTVGKVEEAAEEDDLLQSA